MSEPRIHRLKCQPEPFYAVHRGEKRHEVRVFDRDYQAGDVVVLEEYEPPKSKSGVGWYTGKKMSAIIGHITKPGEWGLPPNVGVFSLLEVTPGDFS